MQKRNMIYIISGAIGMTVLILDGKTAVSGIREGIQICIHTLISALFPFLFLSGMLTDSLSSINPRLFKPLGKLCRIPDSSISLLPVGWLGGYPMGARCASRLVVTGQASPQNATQFAIICNSAGPAFLFGILGSFFSRKSAVFMLWLIHLISAILTGILLTGNPQQHIKEAYTPSRSFTDILNDSLRAMGSICGCVLLFRMILEFLNRWFLWLLPDTLQVLAAGCLELTNGCLQLSRISSESVRFILTSVMLSFGGVCIWLQTLSVFPDIQLSRYMRGKLLQTYFSLILSGAFVFLSEENPYQVAVCIGLAIIPFLLRRHGLSPAKKEVAI